MNALARFEGFVEQLLEGHLIHRLSGSIQPVELAKKLAREMEGNRTVGAGQVYVNNVFEVHLHPDDFRAYAGQRARMERELTGYLMATSAERRLTPAGPLSVRLVEDPNTPRHQARIASHAQERVETAPAAPADYTARLDVSQLPRVTSRPAAQGSLRFLGGPGPATPIRVEHFPFTLGRGLENDLVIEDRRVSRYHAQLRDVHGRLSVVDLDSTNGTFVNGERVRECVLRDGDRLSLGGLELLVHLGY